MQIRQYLRDLLHQDFVRKIHIMLTKRMTSKQPFTFSQGGQIEPLELAYETYGELSPEKDNVVLIHHAISTSSHLTSSTENPEKGWWEADVGPGKAIDTDKFFVICINNLGSCFGSSGPASTNPETGNAYRQDFPEIRMQDIAASQKLLLDQLGIKQLRAVIGNSMGGMISLQFALQYPHMVKKLISVSSCYRSYPVSIAYHTIQKEVMQLDANWNGGYYEKNPTQGLKLARKIGLLSYRDENDLNTRFLHEGDIREYLDYNAEKLSSRFDTNSYFYLLNAMDEFDALSDDKNAFNKIKAESLILSVTTDVLFPPAQQQELDEELRAANCNVTFKSIESSYGHDAFYADPKIANAIMQFV